MRNSKLITDLLDTEELGGHVLVAFVLIDELDRQRPVCDLLRVFNRPKTGIILQNGIQL